MRYINVENFVLPEGAVAVTEANINTLVENKIDPEGVQYILVDGSLITFWKTEVHAVTARAYVIEQWRHVA